jgi:PilZ domain
MLLSAFFGLSRKRSARVVSYPPERRSEERYEAYHPVSISPTGLNQYRQFQRGPYQSGGQPFGRSDSPVAGTVINISLGGAAVHIPGWGPHAPAEWLNRLDRGQELRLDGLVDAQLSCWVVTVDAGVVRVRFPSDYALRCQLREVIDSLAGL